MKLSQIFYFHEYFWIPAFAGKTLKEPPRHSRENGSQDFLAEYSLEPLYKMAASVMMIFF
jgi:hypothetical protein